MLARVVRAMPDRATRRLVSRSLVRYQRPGQNLVRVCFRPEPDDWLELGQIALHMGVSRCLAFMVLVRMLAREKQIFQTTAYCLLVWAGSGTVYRKRLPLVSPEPGSYVCEEVPDGHVSRQSG